MLALREVQEALMKALVLRDGGVTAASLLRSATGLDTHRRLQIYRNNLFETRIAALTAVYPVVARLVGQGFFRSAARAYIQIFPSRSGDLHAFGNHWPEFLREYLPAASLPYLADVAALEWAYHHAYHEEQLPEIDPLHLAQVPPADQAELRLRVQPSASVVRSPYPILRIWQANQPQAVRSESMISLDEGGVDVLVVQRDLEIEFRWLDAAESRWLCALGDGSSLAVATTRALECDDGFDLAAALVRHLATGLFVGVSLPNCDQEVTLC
jgi:hypothetical protein